MSVTKEFTVFLEDRAGTLGKFCQGLADHGVNILALDSFPSGGKSVTRFIVDKPLQKRSDSWAGRKINCAEGGPANDDATHEEDRYSPVLPTSSQPHAISEGVDRQA